MIPGLYDGRDKAFFFAHYEQIRFPNSFTRTRTVFNPRVADGWFRYQFGTEVREVNLLHAGGRQRADRGEGPDHAEADRADRRGDEDHRHAQRQRRSALRQLRLAEPAELFEHQPTVRLDYNLTDNHRLNGSFSQITAKRTPDYLNNADPRFPGAPNQRDFVSKRPLIVDGAALGARRRTSSTSCAAG